MIDTQTKRRAVSGYTLTPVAPVPDGTIGAADREHMAWLYAGIAAGASTASALPYVGDMLMYDVGGATGSISGGLVQAGELVYDSTGATGLIGGITQPMDTVYD